MEKSVIKKGKYQEHEQRAMCHTDEDLRNGYKRRGSPGAPGRVPGGSCQPPACSPEIYEQPFHPAKGQSGWENVSMSSAKLED